MRRMKLILTAVAAMAVLMVLTAAPGAAQVCAGGVCFEIGVDASSSSGGSGVGQTFDISGGGGSSNQQSVTQSGGSGGDIELSGGGGSSGGSGNVGNQQGVTQSGGSGGDISLGG